MIFNFTESESSCFNTVELNGQEVLIRFQSNPQNVYTFLTENEDMIVDYLQNPVGSIGQTYHRWISEKILIPAEELAMV